MSVEPLFEAQPSGSLIKLSVNGVASLGEVMKRYVVFDLVSRSLDFLFLLCLCRFSVS